MIGAISRRNFNFVLVDSCVVCQNIRQGETHKHSWVIKVHVFMWQLSICRQNESIPFGRNSSSSTVVIQRNCLSAHTFMNDLATNCSFHIFKQWILKMAVKVTKNRWKTSKRKYWLISSIQISWISMQYWRRNLWDSQTDGYIRAKMRVN